MTIAIFISFKIPFPIYGLAIWLGRKATPVPFNRIENICGLLIPITGLYRGF